MWGKAEAYMHVSDAPASMCTTHVNLYLLHVILDALPKINREAERNADRLGAALKSAPLACRLRDGLENEEKRERERKSEQEEERGEDGRKWQVA